MKRILLIWSRKILLDGNEFLGELTITILLKFDIIHYMEEMINAARMVYAVNAIIPLDNGKF